MGPGFSHVWAGLEQRLLHAASPRGAARARAVAAASAVVCAGVERADSAGSFGLYAGGERYRCDPRRRGSRGSVILSEEKNLIDLFAAVGCMGPSLRSG